MEYQHIEAKKEIPVCNIMGTDYAAVNMDFLIDFTNRHIRELSGDYMCVSNVQTTVMAYRDEKFLAIQNGGIAAIPDGGPLSTVGRKRGFSSMQRTAGPDYMGEIFKISAEKGYRHFFYGSSEETLAKLRENLLRDYPGIEIVGMISPPFRDLTEEEDREMIERINSADADFVWVGFGAPKREIWMAEHQGKIKGFMFGAGAGFDYFAGNISRAPMWMQKGDLEWLYRLIQEPRRLFMRYLRTNPCFIWNAVIKGK